MSCQMTLRNNQGGKLPDRPKAVNTSVLGYHLNSSGGRGSAITLTSPGSGYSMPVGSALEKRAFLDSSTQLAAHFAERKAAKMAKNKTKPKNVTLGAALEKKASKGKGKGAYGSQPSRLDRYVLDPHIPLDQEERLIKKRKGLTHALGGAAIGGLGGAALGGMAGGPAGALGGGLYGGLIGLTGGAVSGEIGGNRALAKKRDWEGKDRTKEEEKVKRKFMQNTGLY